MKVIPYSREKKMDATSLCHTSPDRRAGPITASSNDDHVGLLHVLGDKWPVVKQPSHINTFQDERLGIMLDVSIPKSY